MGPDKLVRDVNRADRKRVRSLLQTILKNARKVYPGKSLQEAARPAKIDGKPSIVLPQAHTNGGRTRRREQRSFTSTPQAEGWCCGTSVRMFGKR